MPQFKRACRLCGKQVSSVSGLTRHTEVCQKKRKALREIENADRPIPILSQTIQLEPTSGLYTKSTSSTLEERHNFGDAAEYDTGPSNWQDDGLFAITAAGKKLVLYDLSSWV